MPAALHSTSGMNGPDRECGPGGRSHAMKHDNDRRLTEAAGRKSPSDRSRRTEQAYCNTGGNFGFTFTVPGRPYSTAVGDYPASFSSAPHLAHLQVATARHSESRVAGQGVGASRSARLLSGTRAMGTFAHATVKPSGGAA